MEKKIWDSMLDAHLNVRYWDNLGRRYFNRERNLKIFLAIMTSGTVASWKIWGDEILLWQTLSGISALIAIALPILNWPKMIDTISQLKRKWMEILYDYENLWDQRKEGENEIIRIEFERIRKNELKVGEMEINLPNDKKLLDKCRTEVLKSKGL